MHPVPSGKDVRPTTRLLPLGSGFIIIHDDFSKFWSPGLVQHQRGKMSIDERPGRNPHVRPAELQSREEDTVQVAVG